MPTIRAIGFDLDNTLFDHSAAAAKAVELLIEEKGWSYIGENDLANEWKRVEDFFFSKYMVGSLTLIEHRHARMREFLRSTDAAGEPEPGELFDEYLIYYRQCWVAYPDTYSALEELKAAGLRMAVLTNGQQAQQEAKISAMGLNDFFEKVLAIGTVDAIKPDKKAFAHLCRVLESEPSEILFVGDDLDIDVRASIAAGLNGVWLNRHGLPIPKEILAHIETLASIKEII